MSTSSESITTKRHWIGDSASLSGVQCKASCSILPGDICGHGDKEHTPDGEVIQCDLCYAWVYAECEGVTKEQYENLNSIVSTLCNVVLLPVESLPYSCQAIDCFFYKSTGK